MTSRREFFRRLGLAVGAIALAPELESAARQTIPARRIHARIRITGAEITASRHQPGAFSRAVAEELMRAHHKAVADLHRDLVAKTSALPLR